jgi:uncharacterized membrane protein YccC
VTLIVKRLELNYNGYKQRLTDINNSMYYAQVKKFYRSHFFEVLHAFKTAIAFMIAYIIYLFIPHKHIIGQWLFITIAVVMGTHSALGIQVNKSIVRTYATLAGAGFAILAIITPFWHIMLPIYLSIAAIVFTFIGVSFEKYNTVGTLGLATFSIIALSTTPTVEMAIIRTAEIILGILISLFVSRYIIPIRSSKLLKQRALINLGRVADLYQQVFIDNKHRFRTPAIIEHESKVLNSLTTQRQIKAHLKYEHKAQKKKTVSIDFIIRYQAVIYRYFTVFEVSRRILQEELKDDDLFFTLFEHLNESIIEFLNTFIQQYPEVPTALINQMEDERQALLTYTHEKSAESYILSPLHTICFIAHRIIYSCKRLSEESHII